MGTQTLLLIFFALCGVGILGALTAPSSKQGTVLAWIGCFAAIALFLAGAQGLLGGGTLLRSLWSVPRLTVLTLTVDPLSALFLCITGLVLFPAAIFAGAEIQRASNQGNPRTFTVLLLGLFASIGLILAAGDSVLFLLGWEAMSVLCYLLIVHGLLPATQIGPGLVALVVGTTSALLGILYATTDIDLKLMLAHSSVENVGIVIAGVGSGMVFVATNHPALAAIAFVAGLYHLINHSLYKTLLFFGVGAVEAETGTCDMDRLGGLIKLMPLTALGFLAGTLSIAALPPFNRFVSEWLTLQTMLRSAELDSIPAKIVFALCGAGLALTAALAVTCFVKAFAMSFLGMRRLEENQRVTEAKPAVLLAIAILAVLCLAFGVLPSYVVPVLGLTLDPLIGANTAGTLVPPFFASHAAHNTLPPAFLSEFHDLGAQIGQSVMPGRGLVVLHRGGPANPVVFAMSPFYMLAALAILLLATYVVLRLWLTSRRQLVRRQRWDGGLKRLLPEMTYAATGFSNPVRVIFNAVFRPTTVEDTRQTVAEHFLVAIRRERERVRPERLVLRPVQVVALWCAGKLAAMHHGRFSAYAAYALLTLLIVLMVFLLFQV